MLRIKLKAIEHRAPWKQICCHYTHQRPLGWGQKVILFYFLKVVMLHIKLKWKKCRPTCKVTLWIYTNPWPLGLGLKVRYWNCTDVSILLLKLSTKTNLLNMNIYNHLFCCNHTCNCVGMVSVMSASHVTSASHQSRSSIYIQGLIPRIALSPLAATWIAFADNLCKYTEGKKFSNILWGFTV